MISHNGRVRARRMPPPRSTAQGTIVCRLSSESALRRKHKHPAQLSYSASHLIISYPTYIQSFSQYHNSTIWNGFWHVPEHRGGGVLELIQSLPAHRSSGSPSSNGHVSAAPPSSIEHLSVSVTGEK